MEPTEMIFFENKLILNGDFKNKTYHNQKPIQPQTTLQQREVKRKEIFQNIKIIVHRK